MSLFTQNYFIDYAKVLGKGASAQVYGGIRRSDKLPTAVKVIYKRNMKSNDVDNIQKEIIALRKLDNPFHPNVIRLFDMYEDRIAFYICEELVDGGELFERIESKTSYEEADARQLCLQIMLAVKHCHDRNIVHRDLKPENFMMVSRSDDAHIKLVDFGFSIEASENNLRGVLGTPMYMAPEIWADGTYGKPVDMWAMGVIFYIILGGYPPFCDENSVTLGKRIKKGLYAFHDEYWFGISAEAKDFIKKLLVVDQNARMTIDMCFEHPWLLKEAESLRQNDLSQSANKLKEFNATRKLSVAVKTVMLAKRLASRQRAKFSQTAVTGDEVVDISPVSNLRRLYSDFDHGDDFPVESSTSVSSSSAASIAVADATMTGATDVQDMDTSPRNSEAVAVESIDVEMVV